MVGTITDKERGTTQEERGLAQGTSSSNPCPTSIKVNLDHLRNHIIEDDVLLNSKDRFALISFILNNKNKQTKILTIYFEKNISNLDDEAKGLLRLISDTLFNNTSFKIKGFASEEGSENYNYELSKNRAESTKNCLESYAKLNRKKFIFDISPEGEVKSDEYDYFKYRKTEVYLNIPPREINVQKECDNEDNELKKLETKITNKEFDIRFVSSIYTTATEAKQKYFRESYKDDAKRIFNILCDENSKLFQSFIEKLAQEQGQNFDVIKYDIKSQINEDGLYNVYVRLRQIVETFAIVQLQSSSSVAIWAAVPDSYKILWKTLDEFLLH